MTGSDDFGSGNRLGSLRTDGGETGARSVDGTERQECQRCGGQFRVELCDVGGGAGAPRDRIEAYLCYDCRQEVTHERLGVTDGGITEASTDWKLAEINVQSYGHRYVIRTDDDVETAETVRFNGFKLGLDGRAEVEYTELEITEEGYPSGVTANFYDPNRAETPDRQDTETERSGGDGS